MRPPLWVVGCGVEGGFCFKRWDSGGRGGGAGELVSPLEGEPGGRKDLHAQ